MEIYPAIDLYGGKAVRLNQGDYAAMTEYDDDPTRVARDFAAAGARRIHVVDLEGAKTGGTPNFDAVLAVKKAFGGFLEVGGGIRSEETARRYLDGGADRVILGTAAVTDRALLERLLVMYGKNVAVGADLKDGSVAVRGWTERSGLGADEFLTAMERAGVGTVICTDVARDGAMRGANRALYGELVRRFSMEIVASGGVSSLEDVRELKALGAAGAIIGKAYYTGALDLAEAIEAAR